MPDDRFVVREEIQFRCYLTLEGRLRMATEEDGQEAIAEWRRCVARKFGRVQVGHVTLSVHRLAPVFGVDAPPEFVVTGLVAPLDSTLP